MIEINSDKIGPIGQNQTLAWQYHFWLFRMLSNYFVFIIFYHLSNVSGRYKWGKGERKGRDREGQVGQTKHRKHQYISSRCPTPTSVAFVIGIFTKIPYWAGIHVTYYRWNPTLVTGCIVISRVISGNIAFGKGFSFMLISINIESWGLYLMILFRMFIFLSQR